jgi:hypothetical protein
MGDGSTPIPTPIEDDPLGTRVVGRSAKDARRVGIYGELEPGSVRAVMVDVGDAFIVVKSVRVYTAVGRSAVLAVPQEAETCAHGAVGVCIRDIHADVVVSGTPVAIGALQQSVCGLIKLAVRVIENFPDNRQVTFGVTGRDCVIFRRVRINGFALK